MQSHAHHRSPVPLFDRPQRGCLRRGKDCFRRDEHLREHLSNLHHWSRATIAESILLRSHTAALGADQDHRSAQVNSSFVHVDAQPGLTHQTGRPKQRQSTAPESDQQSELFNRSDAALPDPPALKEFFLYRQEIHCEVLQRELCKYPGLEASSSSSVHNVCFVTVLVFRQFWHIIQGTHGFTIRAVQPFTPVSSVRRRWLTTC